MNFASASHLILISGITCIFIARIKSFCVWRTCIKIVCVWANFCAHIQIESNKFLRIVLDISNNICQATTIWSDLVLETFENVLFNSMLAIVLRILITNYLWFFFWKLLPIFENIYLVGKNTIYKFILVSYCINHIKYDTGTLYAHIHVKERMWKWKSNSLWHIQLLIQTFECSCLFIF